MGSETCPNSAGKTEAARSAPTVLRSTRWGAGRQGNGLVGCGVLGLGEARDRRRNSHASCPPPSPSYHDPQLPAIIARLQRLSQHHHRPDGRVRPPHRSQLPQCVQRGAQPVHSHHGRPALRRTAPGYDPERLLPPVSCPCAPPPQHPCACTPAFLPLCSCLSGPALASLPLQSCPAPHQPPQPPPPPPPRPPHLCPAPQTTAPRTPAWCTGIRRSARSCTPGCMRRLQVGGGMGCLKGCRWDMQMGA